MNNEILTTAKTHRDTFLNNVAKLESMNFFTSDSDIDEVISHADILKEAGIFKYMLEGFHYQITKEGPTWYVITCFVEDKDGELFEKEEAFGSFEDELSALVWAIENI